MDSFSRQRAQRRVLWLVAAGISCTMTLTNQMWVGRMSIYGTGQESRRERLPGGKRSAITIPTITKEMQARLIAHFLWTSTA